jgi:hypothetical protein
MDTPAIDAVRFAEGRQTGSLEGPRAALLIQIQQQRRCPGNCAGGCSGRLTRALSMRSSSRTMTASSRSIADMRFWLMGTVTLLGRAMGHHQQHLAEEPGLRLRRPPALVQQRETVGNFAGAQSIYRERLALDHAQRLYGNITDLTVNSNLGGMDNRFVATVAASSSQFNVSQDTLFSSDYVDLNPDRGLYGPRSDEKIYTHLNTASLSFEDRL